MNTEAPLPRKAAPRWWRWGFLLGTPVVFSVGVFGDPETPVREPRIGIWTYGSPLDASSEGKRAYVDDDTLHLLGERGIYMVYGCNRTEAGPKMAGHLERCRACGIEVHLSVTPTATSIDFVNIWSFEALAKDIEEVLVFLSAEGLLGDPVTTLVYDMEPLVEARFPTYGFDRAVVRKLRDYGEVSRAFRRFNGRIRETYGLEKGEADQDQITRFAGIELPAVSLVGNLDRLGWNRGIPEDGGVFHEHSKPFYGAGVTAIVQYPGVPIGYVEGWEDQTIERCFFLPGTYMPRDYPDHKRRVKLGKVDPVVISEVLRDLTALAARAGSDSGTSDHYPVIADLALNESTAAE